MLNKMSDGQARIFSKFAQLIKLIRETAATNADLCQTVLTHHPDFTGWSSVPGAARVVMSTLSTELFPTRDRSDLRDAGRFVGISV